MQDPRNFDTEYRRFFIKNVDYTASNGDYVRMGLTALRTLYSFEAKKNIKNMLKSVFPQIAHIHNFSYHLTPSILSPLVKSQLPVVQTLHDYHIICPSHNLYDFKNQQICEDCRGNTFFCAVKRKCIKGSSLKSFIGSLEGHLAYFLHTYSRKINLFISPSRFLKDKVVEFGLPSDKVVHIPNFVDPNEFVPKYDGSNYFVFFGRLEEFKGVRTMIRAFSKIKNTQLYILGDGSLKPGLEKTITRKSLNNIHLIGYKQGEELKEIIRNSLCTIIPSEWYENNPISILESFALGKPVIGASIGGIPELVKNGINGYLFDPGNSDQLTEIIDFCLRRQQDLKVMGKEARRHLEENYNPSIHYRRIMGVYEEMID
jgi:glycosyltransferase involved in cell wall biosynthesis